MTRSRAAAKHAGSWLERAIADHLAVALGDDGVDRQVKTGAKDKGDIRGVKALTGQKVVIECKEYSGRLLPGEWISEAHVEAGNADAVAGIVIAKRRGTRVPGEQWVLMTVDDLVALLGGAL